MRRSVGQWQFTSSVSEQYKIPAERQAIQIPPRCLNIQQTRKSKGPSPSYLPLRKLGPTMNAAATSNFQIPQVHRPRRLQGPSNIVMFFWNYSTALAFKTINTTELRLVSAHFEVIKQAQNVLDHVCNIYFDATQYSNTFPVALIMNTILLYITIRIRLNTQEGLYIVWTDERR